MRWVSQLKDGYMLKETSNKEYIKVHTGYPYPDTDRPQKEQLYELFNGVFYNFCDLDKFNYNGVMDILKCKMEVYKPYKLDELIKFNNGNCLDDDLCDILYVLGGNKYFEFYAIKNANGVFTKDIVDLLNYNQKKLVRRSNIDYIYTVRSKLYGINNWLDILQKRHGIVNSDLLIDNFIEKIKAKGVSDLSRIIYVLNTDDFFNEDSFIENIVNESYDIINDVVTNYYTSADKCERKEEINLISEMKKFSYDLIGFDDFVRFEADINKAKVYAYVIKNLYWLYLIIENNSEIETYIDKEIISYLSISIFYVRDLVKNNLDIGDESFSSKFSIKLKGVGKLYKLSDIFRKELFKECYHLKPCRVEDNVLYFDTGCVCSSDISPILRDIILDNLICNFEYPTIIKLEDFLSTVCKNNRLSLAGYRLMFNGVDLIESKYNHILSRNSRERGMCFSYVCHKKLCIMMINICFNRNFDVVISVESGFDGFYKFIHDLDDIIFARYIQKYLLNVSFDDNVFYNKSDYSFSFDKSSLEYKITKK